LTDFTNYLYPGTNTLKNRFGERSLGELLRREASVVAVRRTEIDLGAGPQGQFDADHLKAIHRHLFQDVYEWAGHTRDERVPLSDGTTATAPEMRRGSGKEFTSGRDIPIRLRQIAGALQDANNLRGLTRAEFAVQAADLLASINAVHPFREGNGRTQRTFLRELARAAGHTLDFSVISQERMIQASIAAHDRDDTAMMRRLFSDATDPDRIAALRRAIDFLDKHGFDWNERYVATVEPGHHLEAILVGIAGGHFMARTRFRDPHRQQGGPRIPASQKR
jgi:cell filamentation protein